MNETLFPAPAETAGPAELLAKRVQQSLQVILAGLEERDGLTFDETEDLKRDLSMLLHRERMQIASVEIDRSEQILAYMLRPAIDECLNLWFGKSEQTDQEIWNRFGVEVGLASRGDYDHWALDIEHPRLLVALVILLDQFPRNMYRETAKMYACDAHCRSLVKRGLRTGVAARLRPIERVFLCLALTHSEVLEDQHLCMHEWNQAMAVLQPEDPLNAFHEIFHRHVAVIKRFGRFPHRNKLLQRTNTAAEEDFLGDNSFRFDLPLIRQSGGAFVFAGAVQRRKVNLLGHEYENSAARPRGRAARRIRVQLCGSRERFLQGAPPARKAGLHSDWRQRARLHGRDESRSVEFLRVRRRRVVRAFLTSGRLHARMHDGIGSDGKA